MAVINISESLQWIVMLWNTFSTIVGKEAIEDVIKQRMPGWLGLSLADEQIFASLLASLFSQTL